MLKVKFNIFNQLLNRRSKIQISNFFILYDKSIIFIIINYYNLEKEQNTC